MAKMFPDRLPDNVKSPAERRLYKAFQEQLSDDFTVFHQVRWQVKNLRNGAKDGEADFVIACPKLGILVLEVKGGSISYNGGTGKWLSNNNSIKDPFQQVCDSKYNLLYRLKELPYWSNRWIPMDYGVAFPDIEVNGWLPPHAHHEIILDGTQLNDLSDWVKSVLKYWHGQNPPQGNFDARGVQELVKILRPSITAPVLLPFAENEQEFKRLTEQQIGILDFLASHRRVAISGCAGSGKTLLALEKARRLHEQGFNVLLTCYNRGLAQFLRQRLGGKQNLHVYSFHGLCEKLFRQAGLPPDNDIPQDKLFNEIYPNLLIEAADQLGWRVDAVIVDEGQDFPENWWVALKLLLNEPDNGIFYFFHDSNQNIFGKGWQPPLEEAPFSLTNNCRNTQKIHSYVLQFYTGQDSTIALGPLGKDVEIVSYPSNNNALLRSTLSRLLHRLVVQENVATKDIVILTTKQKQALQNQDVGQFRIKADPDTSRNEILCNTIGRFKGLESPVVILVETEMNNNNYLRKLLYVGASRARHQLIILRPNNSF
jgi:superfamily I DNA/RNA helicase